RAGRERGAAGGTALKHYVRPVLKLYVRPNTGKPLTRSLEHQAEVVSAAFSPDGTRVVTASWDNTARVWDAATGKPLTRSLEHQAEVVSAAFSPDGTRVVTANWDNTARVWDVLPDTGALPQWTAIAERSPFVLDEHGALMRRSELGMDAAFSTATQQP